jgi:hypothetical protein
MNPEQMSAKIREHLEEINADFIQVNGIVTSKITKQTVCLVRLTKDTSIIDINRAIAHLENVLPDRYIDNYQFQQCDYKFKP